MAQTVLVCVKELNTRSRVQISTSLDQFHSYGIHVQFTVLRAIYSRGRRLRPRDRPRSPQRPPPCMCRICTCTSRRARAATCLQRTQSLVMRRSRASSRCMDHAPRAQPPAAAQSTKSLPSLADEQPGDAHAHGSEPTVDCQHAKVLATLPPAAKLAQPPFASKPAECCDWAPR